MRKQIVSVFIYQRLRCCKNCIKSKLLPKYCFYPIYWKQFKDCGIDTLCLDRLLESWLVPRWGCSWGWMEQKFIRVWRWVYRYKKFIFLDRVLIDCTPPKSKFELLTESSSSERLYLSYWNVYFLSSPVDIQFS